MNILQSVPEYIQILSLIISAASAIAALTPSAKDDSVLAKAKGVVNFLALNFGGAKPKQ